MRVGGGGGPAVRAVRRVPKGRWGIAFRRPSRQFSGAHGMAPISARLLPGSPMDQPTVSLGSMFDLFANDEAWMRKTLTVGACVLIPIVGIFQVLGYARRAYQHMQAGNTDLPEPSLGEDIGGGFKTWLLTLLNIMPAAMLLGGCWAGCAFGSVAVGGGLAAATSGDGGDAGPLGGLVMMAGMLGGYAVLFVGVLLIGVLSVDLTRRLYNDESFPLFSPGASLGAIKRNPGAFLMTWLGLFISRMIGGIGVILCYVGIFLTMPLGMVLSARVLAQWDKVVKANAPAEELY